MEASKDILLTWRKFDGFPMETLTKAWFFQQDLSKKQRNVSQMREHRNEYGITGNCFDLTIWLLEEFAKDGIEAYPIGHRLGTSGAHVAVVALDERGNRYLCDLGDQWIKPILIDSKSEDYIEGMVSGFFPGANVEIKPKGENLEISYHRSNGKISRQTYSTLPIEMKLFLEAAEISQNLMKDKPLLECRTSYKHEVAHWEFYNWQSFLSTSEGMFDDQPLGTVEEWADKINLVTGYDKRFLMETLHFYKKFAKE